MDILEHSLLQQAVKDQSQTAAEYNSMVHRPTHVSPEVKPSKKMSTFSGQSEMIQKRLSLPKIDMRLKKAAVSHLGH